MPDSFSLAAVAEEPPLANRRIASRNSSVMINRFSRSQRSASCIRTPRPLTIAPVFYRAVAFIPPGGTVIAEFGRRRGHPVEIDRDIIETAFGRARRKRQLGFWNFSY